MSQSLQTMVQESGLEPSKAKAMLEQFQGFFEVAEEWEAKAKAILVTDATQTDVMAQAREGRLILKNKRIAIEKTRKALKEQALREGRAIDGIANVLKALIVPLEQHLDQQEHFVEIKAQEAADRERKRIEAEVQAKREAEEKAEREEQERIRAENARLKKEAEEREAEMAAERKEAEDKARIEREKAEAEKREMEAAARREREKAEAEAAELRAEADRKAVERANAEAQLEAEKKKLAELESRLPGEIECPSCHHRFVPEKAQVHDV